MRGKNHVDMSKAITLEAKANKESEYLKFGNKRYSYYVESLKKELIPSTTSKYTHRTSTVDVPS